MANGQRHPNQHRVSRLPVRVYHRIHISCRVRRVRQLIYSPNSTAFLCATGVSPVRLTPAHSPRSTAHRAVAHCFGGRHESFAHHSPCRTKSCRSSGCVRCDDASRPTLIPPGTAVRHDAPYDSRIPRKARHSRVPLASRQCDQPSRVSFVPLLAGNTAGRASRGTRGNN